jgi:predicted PurR-regulated permease PerM
MSANYETQQPRSRRSDVVFTFAMTLLLYVAWLARDVLLLLYASALFAVVLMPVVSAITRLRIGKWQPSRGVAVLMLLLTVVLFVVLFFTFAMPPVVRDMRQFAGELPTRGPALIARVRKLPFMQHVDFSAFEGKLQDIASHAATYAFISIKSWASTLFDAITAIVLTVYFMLEGETAYAWALSFFPQEQRGRLDRTLARAEVRMGKWLLGQASLMAILGVSSTIVFLCLRVRYAYALGVLMGLFNLIPVAGALVTVTLALMVAAIDSWCRVLGVAIFYAIYAQVETSYLTPRIMKSSVDLAGLAVMVSLLLGAALEGVVGAMVSVPTAVLVAVLIDEYLVKSKPVLSESKPVLSESKPGVF